MRRFSTLLTPVLSTVLLILAVASSGCTADDPSDVAPDTTMGDATPAGDTALASHTFAFSGDFSGPLGLQLYSIRQEMSEDVPGTLAWVRQTGFDEVELAGTYGLSPQEFRQELDNAGLDATSMHTGYERFRDSIDVVLNEAEALGVEYVGIAWIPHEGSFTVEQAREVAADFNSFGQAASERGFQFFYHNHGYEFEPADDGTIPFDVLAEETDPEDVKFQIDVFWTAHPGVDSAELLRKYPNRWVLMHIKDMREGVPTGDFSGQAPPEAKVPVGAGQIDWPSVLTAAEEVGLQRYYIEDESTDPMGNIPLSIRYLEEISY